MIQDSASSAALCAILAARERATGGQGNLTGADGSLVAYTSTQAHSSVEKGVRIAGLGSDNLRLIEVDEQYRHAARPAGRGDRGRPGGRPPPVLRLRHGRHDLVDGHRPAAARSAQICREHGLWLHVDARAGRHGRALPRVPLRCTTAWNWPTATASIRTSGCSPTSTATASSSPTAAQLIRTLSILPEYLRNKATRVGRGDRLPRLADPAGPAVPRAEAVVRASARSASRGCSERIRQHVALAQRVRRLGRRPIRDSSWRPRCR